MKTLMYTTHTYHTQTQTYAAHTNHTHTQAHAHTLLLKKCLTTGQPYPNRLKIMVIWPMNAEGMYIK